MRRPAIENIFIPARCASDLSTFQGQSGNILVISPHPDDDVIGVGGTMALLAQGGKNIFSLYITDGSGCPRGALRMNNKTMARTRQQEALEALKVVRAQGGIFLGFHSETVLGSCKTAMTDAIIEVLKFFLPESVYLPSPLDRHPTHRAVTAIAVSSLRRINGYLPMLWGYSVWGGIWGIHGLQPVDISSVIKLKKMAIQKHRSQLSYKAYDEGILGRNRYEAVFLETHEPEKSQHVEFLLDMQELLMRKKMTINNFVSQLVKDLW
jgi:LmbE family N-acetylglucosaminyl deacetylase